MTDHDQANRVAALHAVSLAIRRGELHRPNVCELCGLDVQRYNARRSGDWCTQIVGHHWRGYRSGDHLAVWWVCSACNYLLRGPEFHNDLVTKEYCRAYVLAFPRTQARLAYALGKQAALVVLDEIILDRWPPPPPPTLPPAPKGDDGPARFVGWYQSGGVGGWLDQYLVLHADGPPRRSLIPVPPMPACPPELPPRAEEVGFFEVENEQKGIKK